MLRDLLLGVRRLLIGLIATAAVVVLAVGGRWSSVLDFVRIKPYLSDEQADFADVIDAVDPSSEVENILIHLTDLPRREVLCRWWPTSTRILGGVICTLRRRSKHSNSDAPSSFVAVVRAVYGISLVECVYQVENF